MHDPDQPITFVIPGTRQDGSVSRGLGDAVDWRLPEGLEGDLKASVRVGSRRAGGETHRITAQPGVDVVVLQIDNGPSLVLHPSTARDLLMAQSMKQRGISRGPAGAAQLEVGPQEVEVSSNLQWQGLENASAESTGASRGFLGDVVLKVIDVIGLKARLQERVAEELARRIDDRVIEGVYALSPDALTPLKGQTPLPELPPAPAGAPCLVLLHGTFSTTSESGFAKLWAHYPSQVAALFRHYGDRVYALDHATLGRSPIENALTLARACPPGTVLHLISHSRGGLVAEVLSRAADLQALDPAGEDLFRDPRWQPQRQLLEELIAIVQDKRLKVERTVRVACPARGTLLASQRLDAYISVLRWALNLAGLPVVPELVAFLAGVARERTDPASLPGLAVMAPDSPLIQWLHAAERAVPGELRVVSGDLQGTSVGSWVKTLVADAFFWTDNDLVVQTRSMYGGAPRSLGATFVLDRGGASSHFNYFTNERTAAAIVSGLIEANPAGWRLIGPLSTAGESSTGERGARRGESQHQSQPEKPAVILLPGILGSHLAVNGQRIWLSWRLLNGFSQLDYPDSADRHIEPDGPIGLTYDALQTFLAQSHEVLPFSYDWRLPMEQEALRLAKDVEAALDARQPTGQPVRLLAHSMGGLLARALQIASPPIWDRLMAQEGARLLMLGTPNEGSWAPMQVLSGDDSFGNTLTAVGAPFQDTAARAAMAGFPGFLQLQAGLLDSALPLNTHQGWQQLAEADLNQVNACSWWHQDPRQLDGFRWGVPEDGVLAQAVRFWEKLRRQRDEDLPLWRDKLALVVGAAPYTTVGYESRADGLVYLEARDGGDGRVAHASALLPGVPTWQLDSDHGQLPAVKHAFRAFKDLLETGDTKLLARFQDPGATRGGGPGTPPFSLRASRPSRQRGTSLPRSSEDDLYRLAQEPSPADDAVVDRPLPITVLNGNLKFVRQVLMLGHYTSTTLTGTEAVVDRLIGGTMKQALALGCYPDRPGSQQFFRNFGIARANPLQPPRPESVIVVGLGEEGKLSPADLTFSVCMAVMALAQRRMEDELPEAHDFELAATLLGSGGSRIDAGLAAQCIAQGVRDANTLLRQQGRWPSVRALQLVELYLDRASQALSALLVQAETQPGQYAITPTVSVGQGWERRPLDWGYRGTGYDFISALTGGDHSTEQSSSVIEYTMDSRRARREMRAQTAQRRLVEQLVATASNDLRADSPIGRTLFKLLVPVDMEAALGGTSAMLLELDEGSAPIPWEMLDTESGVHQGDNPRPWAIRSKLLRKLRLDAFRPQPRDASRVSEALVIGEPRCDDPAFPRLPGARREAEAVSTQLKTVLGSERVTTLISDDPQASGPDAQAVITTLLKKDWRIVHISGHGDLPNGEDPRGVILSDGLYLGPREIRTMRVVPELVFVNCCHLGGIDQGQLLAKPYNRPKFAAGVAGQLIEIGVRCVVAAGWAVADDAAETFAREFYAALLRGQRFMDAIAVAREAAWQLAGNTWAAYQCYGDPDWLLIADSIDPQNFQVANANPLAGVVSAQALVLLLESLTNQAKFQDGDLEHREIGKQLQDLESRYDSLWGDKGEVARCFAKAWAVVKNPDRAIDWYERALQAEDGAASLESYEQLLNLRVKEAWRQVEEAWQTLEMGRRQPATDQEALSQAVVAFEQVVSRSRERITLAAMALEQLVAIGGTMERLNLCGSAQKRLAMLERKAGNKLAEDHALVAMGEWYGEAEAVAASRGLADGFYPGLNRVAAACVRHAGDPSWSGLDSLDSLRQALSDKVRSDPDFWSVIGQVELALYQALASRSLKSQREAIQAGYANLHLRMQDPGQWGSAWDQLEFVLPIYIERLADADPAEADAAKGLLAQVKAYAG